MSAYNVLIPLDGSSFSRQILPVVRRLLSPQRSTLTLLRVTAPPEPIYASPELRPTEPLMLSLYEAAHEATLVAPLAVDLQLEESERAALTAELQEDVYYLQAAGFKVIVEVRFGDPAAEIISAAASGRFDLVALATHGRSAVQRLVLGSVAEQVLRRVTTPVLAVRPWTHQEHGAE